MAPAPARFPRECLAQCDPGFLDIDIDAEPAVQPFQRDIALRFAQAPQHQLMGPLVVLHPQGRVFGDQPRQPLRKLVLVGLAVGTDGGGQQGFRHLPRLDQQGESAPESVSPVRAWPSLVT